MSEAEPAHIGGDTERVSSSELRRWHETTLGEIAEVQGGITKGKQRTPGEKLREVPYLRVANVQRGYLDLSEVKEIEATEEEILQYCLHPGDVLFNEGGDRDKLGRGWVWSSEIGECIHQNHVFRARIHAGVLLPKLLSWYGNSEGQTYFLKEGKQTTNLASLNSTKLRALPVLIPPALEQYRIVAAVESYFSRLDDAVGTLERVERNLKRYRASVLKSAVEGRLVPTEVVLAKQAGRSYEPASVLLERILAERRRRWSESGRKGKYEEPASPDTNDLPELPDGWCWATVDQLALDVTYGSSAKTNEGLEDGIPVLRMGNIVDGYLDYSELKFLPVNHLEFPELLLRAGDLLFNRTNSPELVGKTAVVATDAKASFASYLIRARFAKGIQSQYVSYFINSLTGRQWIRSVVSQQVGQANVNGSKLKACSVPLPPGSEQVRIVAEVERAFSVAFAAAGQVRQDLARCARLRQSILKWAFEGKLADQDPKDEAASVLVERIKAERAAGNSAKATGPRRPAKKKQVRA